MIITLTKNQIIMICSALTEKVKDAYKAEGIELKENSTPSSYDILTSEINIANNISKSRKDAQNGIKSEWLSKLYYNHRTKESANFEIETLNLCSVYLENLKWQDYTKKLNPQPFLHSGDFAVYWKGTTLESDDAEITYEYNLCLTEDKCIFSPKDHKNTIFRGETPHYIGGNLYLNFTDNHGLEKLSIIIHIGVADIQELEYLSAIFLAVDSDLTPCSGPMLLVKKEVVKIDEYFVQEYFNRFNRKTLVKAIRVNRLRKMVSKLKLKHDEEARLKGLFGNWMIITKKKNKAFEKSKLQILSRSNILFESLGNSYKDGRLELRSGEFVILNLLSAHRFATIIGEVGYFDKLNTINYINCVYATTGRFSPQCGMALMIRVTDEFSHVNIGEISETDLLSYKVDSDIWEKFSQTENIYIGQ